MHSVHLCGGEPAQPCCALAHLGVDCNLTQMLHFLRWLPDTEVFVSAVTATTRIGSRFRADLARSRSTSPCRAPQVRIYRIQRDIPMPLVTSGVEKGNLRELALARMARLGLRCRDVRTREVGIQDIHHRVTPDEVELVRRDYAANDGWETFLAYEDPRQDILVGLLRLRQLCSAPGERQAGLTGACCPACFGDARCCCGQYDVA